MRASDFITEQGVTEGTNNITYKQQKGKNKFSVEMLVDGKPAGMFQYDANTGRTITELDPAYRGQGLGQRLILKGIYTAAMLGMDYVEDESRTAMFDRALDGLADAGYIVNDEEYWYVTDSGEQFLKQALKQGVAEGLLNEYRDRLLQYVKNLLPTWPEYVLKDWLVPNKGDFSNLPDTELKNGIMEKLKGAGLTSNSKWQLVPDMKFTMDMFDPKTKQLLAGRAGGTSDLGMGIPKDKERHATQAALAQQQGGVRKEPVLLIKTAKGYELLEGWHRTIQHFVKYPDGYTGPAYVAVAQGQQGVAEAEKIGGKYDPEEFDAMVSRLGQKAKQGPMKTVWDPIKRVYKNVPVNQNKQAVKEYGNAQDPDDQTTTPGADNSQQQDKEDDLGAKLGAQATNQSINALKAIEPNLNPTLAKQALAKGDMPTTMSSAETGQAKELSDLLGTALSNPQTSSQVTALLRKAAQLKGK